MGTERAITESEERRAKCREQRAESKFGKYSETKRNKTKKRERERNDRTGRDLGGLVFLDKHQNRTQAKEIKSTRVGGHTNSIPSTSQSFTSSSPCFWRPTKSSSGHAPSCEQLQAAMRKMSVKSSNDDDSKSGSTRGMHRGTGSFDSLLSHEPRLRCSTSSLPRSSYHSPRKPMRFPISFPSCSFLISSILMTGRPRLRMRAP